MGAAPEQPDTDESSKMDVSDVIIDYSLAKCEVK